jgi:hypothetical protein
MRLGQPAFLVIFFFLFVTNGLRAQETNHLHTFESYISNMQSVMIDSLKGNWISDNIIHNRINYFYYPNNHFTFSAQMRSRIIYGESVKYNNGYAASIDNDQGFLDLSMNIANEKSFLINTSLDRLFLKYSNGNFVTIIGRQRINWGQNYVWNPNDIFNVQNFFDFDYIEKPGSDAVRIQYYTGPASNAEFVAKLDKKNNLTSALYYRFNKWGYDFQLLGGIFEQTDYVAGAGFTGHINSIGLNGEYTFFKPLDNAKDSGSMMLLGIGADYMFSNSLYLQFEGLYQYSEKKQSINDFYSWYAGSLNVKKLSFSEFSFFSNLSYSFTPLLNSSITVMIFPEINGFFTGPSLNYSITQNMEFSTIFQAFSGVLPDPVSGIKTRKSLYLGFLRYKVNF